MRGSKPRRARSQRSAREYKLGKYLILTDTEETESNYLNGLKAALPQAIREQLLIKVIPNAASIAKIIDKALELSTKDVNYTEVWLAFDFDNRLKIDAVVKEAQEKNLHVAWSNPCLEIWFHAYFGSMPSCDDQVQCCDSFAMKFSSITGQRYKKSNVSIYAVLKKFGDEAGAMKIAKVQYEKYRGLKPSHMTSCTTMHMLVEKIAQYCAK